MSKKTSKSLITVVAIGAVLALVYLFISRSGIDLQHIVDVLRTRINAAGALAPLLYIASYAVGAVLFIPGSALTILGGVIFGPIFGTIYTVIGATIGAVIAFIIARYFGASIAHRLEAIESTKFSAYYQKTELHGLSTVLFLRFVPLFPFSALNYALGLTKVRFRDYVLGTFFGIIPGTCAYVYFGDSLASLNPLYIGIAISILVLLSLVAGKLEKRMSKKTIV